jgi:hypothetical protein
VTGKAWDRRVEGSEGRGREFQRRYTREPDLRRLKLEENPGDKSGVIDGVIGT